MQDFLNFFPFKIPFNLKDFTLHWRIYITHVRMYTFMYNRHTKDISIDNNYKEIYLKGIP